MRITFAVAVSTVMASAGAAGTLTQPVDLNRPGALEELKLERPKHHAAITGVLRAVERIPCDRGELETLKARFEISDLACSFLLLTRDPPKRRLNFELEGTHYVATVTMQDIGARVVPARR